jgi:glycosyltransferase involved in cell wall biosynthesis
VVARRILIVSYRLGGMDGVSVEAAKWKVALAWLGAEVDLMAGEAPLGSPVSVDPSLSASGRCSPDVSQLRRRFAGYDLVVAENICSLPLNKAAFLAVAEALDGRPAILHHHDLPWQRPATTGVEEVPDSEAWVHVAINDFSAAELRQRGYRAVVRIHNAFFDKGPQLSRASVRASIRAGTRPVYLHPSRAISRKRVDLAMEVAFRAGAVYWLTGRAEDGYAKELERLKRRYKTKGLRIWHGPGLFGAGLAIEDAYHAADAVLLPSSWEGFGNATVEGSIARKPVMTGDHPVARELMRFGFAWYLPHQVEEFIEFVGSPDREVLERNRQIALEHFGMERLKKDLAGLLTAF